MRLSLNIFGARTTRLLGVWVFCFFLAKGLLWLLIPAALVWWGASATP
jgi:hypothetical protein